MSELDKILAGMNEALITPAAALTMDAEKTAAEHNKAKQQIKDLMLELIENLPADAHSLSAGPMVSKDKLRQKVEEL